MNDKTLHQRMTETINMWYEDEDYDEWWIYQRDYLEARNTIEAQATRIEALEADNARLVKANGLRMDELHKERKEAKLWFEQAQEWKARNEALEAALRDSMTAIDDWLHVYAYDMCDEADVRNSHKRIANAGGTLSYIASVQKQNRGALESQP